MAKWGSMLAFGLLLLAGCSGGPEPSAQPSTPANTTVTTVVGERIEPVYTDTLHFLGYPDLTPEAPDGSTDLRIPLAPFNDYLAQQLTGSTDLPLWHHTLAHGLTGLAGTATFWVDVKGTVLNNPNPGAGGCFWELRFLTGSGLDDGHYAPCVTEPATVATGVREIVFTYDLPGIALREGQRVEIEFYTQDFGRSPDASIDLLTNSIAHDSRMQVVGLKLPLDDRLLFTA